MDVIAKLTEALNGKVDHIVGWAVVLAAVATVVMALLEAAKATFRLRYLYHWALVRNWLGDAGYKELLAVVLGRDKRPGPLLDQPTDKLLAQLQAASNLALDFPKSFPNLYALFTSVAAGSSATRDAETWRRFSEGIESGEIQDPASDPRAAEATRARARLDHLVARKLDAFQTKTEYWWARLNQFVAVVGSAWVLLKLFQTPTFGHIALSIVGGAAAPVAKDIAAALSGMRGK